MQSVKVSAGFGYYRCSCDCGWATKFTYKSRQHSRMFERMARIAAYDHQRSHLTDDTRTDSHAG